MSKSGTIAAVIQSMNIETKNQARPSVMIANGSVRSFRIGFRIVFSTPNTAAAKISVPNESLTVTPLRRHAAASANAFAANETRIQRSKAAILRYACPPIIDQVSNDDWRVEVELDDDEHGYSVAERLRALDLDDNAKHRLGSRAIVTRDGSKLFVYTRTGTEAGEALRVVRELLAADDLTADVRTTRWHPVEEAWEDASVPLPQTEAEQEQEQDRQENRERAEVESGGDYDWHVHVHTQDRAAAEALERRLKDEGLHVERRWSYVTIGALTDDQANEIGSRIRGELPNAEIEIKPTLELSAFMLMQSWF